MAGAYAELHCHSNFSFLDGASPADELAERAAALGHQALAVTDHQGLYGAVRFAGAMRELGLRPVIGLEVELLDSAVDDPTGLVVPRRRRGRKPVAKQAPPEQVSPEQVRWSRSVTAGPVGHRSSACVRPAIASHDARTCAASVPASSARTSCCWRAT
jgi:hypothetical protein